MRTSIDVIRDARAVLTDPKRWTKGAMCRRISDGLNLNRTVREGADYCYCTLGAIELCSCREPYNDEMGSPAELLQQSLDRAGNGMGVMTFNDDRHTTHEMVLRMFDSALPASA